MRSVRTILWSLARWVLPVLAVAGWYLATKSGPGSALLPPPTKVLLAAGRLVESGQLALHILVSLRRAAIGFLIGGGIGFVLGVLAGVSRTCEAIWDTTLQMVRTIPHLALAPLVILWFGVGEEAKVFLVALGVFFPIYLNTLYGFRTVDQGLVEMARTYHVGFLGLFRHVLLPGALPSVLVGVRQALGIAWLSLVVAESLAANAGIGYIVTQARDFVQMDVILVGIVLYALIGKGADVLTRILERKWLVWHAGYSSGKW